MSLRKCLACGASNSRGAKFCQSCGQTLSNDAVGSQFEPVSEGKPESWAEWRRKRQDWGWRDWNKWLKALRERNAKTWRYNSNWRNWTRRDWLWMFIVAIFVVVIIGIMATGTGTPTDIQSKVESDISPVSGMPYCHDANVFVLAGASGVSVLNQDDGCTLKFITVTLNDRYKCTAFLSLSDEPLSRPVSNCVDQDSGERFNPLTTAVVKCKVTVNRPRLRSKKC